MSVAMQGREAPLRPQYLIDLDSRLGVSLPAPYRQFPLEYNVAVPECNSYDGGQHVSATTFFGVSPNPYDDLVEQNLVYEGRMPQGVLAIADAPCRNLICLHLTTGAVYYWDHEQEAAAFGYEEPSFDNMLLLAWSFTEFLQRLQPFDPESVPFDPKQVISVESSPEAREKFKKYFKEQK